MDQDPVERPPVERIYYDGGCGVCHWAVAFVARRDPDGSRFRFAPLAGETCTARIPATVRSSLPDSLVVERADGTLLLRSSALVHLLRRLGGLWGVLAGLVWLVPRPLRDWAYDRFARIRHRLAAEPDGACPLMPPAWGARFDP